MEENSLAAILATKRLAGITPEVNLPEHVTCAPPPSVNGAAHSGFETQGRCHQKSKTGVSVAPKKGLVSSKNIVKKTKKHDALDFIKNNNLRGTNLTNLKTFGPLSFIIIKNKML